MEVNVVSINRTLTLVSVAILILIIAVPSVITVNKRHNERLLYAATTKIKEKAKFCFDKEDCLNQKITLKQLYDLGYLE